MPVIACCTAWAPGGSPVQIAAQEVLIVWDKEQGIEHFIRRSNFQAKETPEDFGFLVPTPTQPNLSEVPDNVFDQLGDLIRPKIKIEKKTKFSFTPVILMPFTSTGGLKNAKSVQMESASVEVLETTVIGGFEVAVLRASKTEALLLWLKENNYDARPELREWVTPYVEKKWIITAFKYTNETGQADSILSRASVCLSFEAAAPFFPYRVPSDISVKPKNGSLLRLYFAGQERVTGEFEAGADDVWNATSKFSNHDEGMTDILKTVVGHSGSSAKIPTANWLTAFEDKTWPGGSEDLYFLPSPNKDAIPPLPS